MEFYTIGDAFSYELLLLVVMIYTVIFAVKYLKREFTIIFLILLGPISCITYPIDKISDGKAQAFNKWFAEFLYQVIIQPFHLLIYTVLISSAVQLADDNLLYSIVCFTVMMPAEKFIKEMFGFKDKLGSPLGALATGAAMGQMINKLRGASGRASGGAEKSETTKTVDTPSKTKQIEFPEGNSGALEGAAGGTAAEAVNSSQNESVDTSASERIDNAQGEEEERRQIEQAAENQIGNSENSEKSENSEDSENSGNSQNSEKELKEPGRFRGTGQRIRDKHNQRMLAKYGTIGKGNLAKARGARALKSGRKLLGRTIKGATTLGTSLGGAALIGTIGLMTGQGAKGFVAGAGVGAAIGKKAGKIGDNVAGKIGSWGKDYAEAISGKDKQKKEFMANPNKMATAKAIFRDNHNGNLGSAEDINDVLEKMYYLKERGIDDKYLEDGMEQYYDNLAAGYNEQTALSLAALSTKNVQDYSAKDFRDEKVMNNLFKDYKSKFIAAGYGQNEAEEMVRRMLIGAGSMRGVNKVALPKAVKEIEENLATSTLSSRIGTIPKGEAGRNLIQQEIELHRKLKNSFGDDAVIQQLNAISKSNGEKFETVVKRAITIKEDYEKTNNSISKTTIDKLVGKGASKQEINEQIIDIVELQGVTGKGRIEQSDLSQIGELIVKEQRVYQGDKDKISESRRLGRKAIKNGNALAEKDKAGLKKGEIKLIQSYGN